MDCQYGILKLWESVQCCPDIQLLPDLAKNFTVSVGELLGYSSVSETEDIVPAICREMGSLTKGEAFGFVFRMAATLYQLTVHSKTAYASVAQISDKSGISPAKVRELLPVLPLFDFR